MNARNTDQVPPIIEDVYGQLGSEPKMGESVEDLYRNNLKDDMQLMKALTNEANVPEKKWTYDTRDTKDESDEEDNSEKKEKEKKSNKKRTDHRLVKRAQDITLLQPRLDLTEPLTTYETFDPVKLMKKTNDMKEKQKEPAADEDDALYYHLNGEFYRSVVEQNIGYL